MGWRGRATNHFQKLPLSEFRSSGGNFSVVTKANIHVCIFKQNLILILLLGLRTPWKWSWKIVL